MKNKSLKIPTIIIAIGLILMVAAYFLTSVQKKPIVTEQDFAYSVTYKVDGETKTLEGVYTCRFSGFGDNGIDPLTKYFVGEYTVDGVTTSSRRYTIAEKDGYTLDIITLFDESYLMGDKQTDIYYELEPPCLEAMDAEGLQYGESEMPIAFDAEIVSWKYPEPIKNSFVFAGFSGLYIINMSVMLLVGLFTLIICVIFVKKGDDVVYSALDKIGVALNFVIAIVVLPFISVTACFVQAYPTGPDWIYQLYLCVPPITPLSLAVSVSLRRKGFRLGGFLIQFLFFVLLAIPSVLEYIL